MSEPASSSEPVLPLATPVAAGQAAASANKANLALHPATSIIVLAWAVRLVSLFNMLHAILRYQPKFIFWLGKWVPFEISEGYRIRMFLMSVLLFVLASGLQRGKRLAWQLTVGGLMLAPLLHLGRAVIWPQALLNLALIVLLIAQRKYFRAQSDHLSVRSAFIICPVLALALVTFGTARLHVLHKQVLGDHTWLGCLQTSCELVVAHRADTETPTGKQALELFSILRIGGTMIALLGLVLILRPVLLRRKVATEQRDKVRNLILLYGKDSLDPYALLSDKSYFFIADDRAVVPYVLSGNMAIALADPIGHPSLRPRAIEEFTLFCRSQAWEPVFYETTEELFSAYQQAGFSLFKIGEEALVKTAAFNLKGNDFQNLRTARNRAQKLGIQFRWYEAEEGYDEVLEAHLTEISYDWLNRKKTPEMSFDMGSFALEDIRSHGVAVAIDSAGRPLAFATWRPFSQGHGRALDLMRSLPEARNVMDFILVESILRFSELGVTDVSLGTAPLANQRQIPSGLIAEEKVVLFLFENLNRIYGYKSLFEFKRKYRPKWGGRYVAYRRGVGLPLVGLALVRVHAPTGLWKFLVG